MIQVDSRFGSKPHTDRVALQEEVYNRLRTSGLPVTLTRLPYGDIAFMGIGPEGRPVSVGIELKTIHDCLGSMCDGRFAGHQLPGMIASYEQPWFLVEGLWRGNAKTGLLEYRAKKGDWREAHIGSRRFMLSDLQTWLFTMTIKGGVQVSTISDSTMATVWISTLYKWWTSGKGGWDGHKSHLAFHDGTRHGRPFARQSVFGGLRDRAVLVRPTTCRQVLAQLPGVGWEKSARLAKMFPTVENLMNASVDDLQTADGIGPVLAAKVYQSLRSIK